MNMISTGAFQTEMDASNNSLPSGEIRSCLGKEKCESSASRRRILMALSLAACGSDDDDSDTADSGETNTSSSPNALTVSADNISPTGDVTAARGYTQVVTLNNHSTK